MNKDEQVNVPLHTAEDYPPPAPYEFPPAYEHPKIDFNGGWKDRAFAILFWIHGIIVIVLGTTLGVPAMLKTINNIDLTVDLHKLDKVELKPFIFGLAGALVMSIFASVATLLLLRLCSRHFIRNAFILMVTLELTLTIILYFIHPAICFIPGFCLILTLIYICCVQKRIQFSEAHLQAGCSALNAHNSLIFVAIFMIFIEFVWFCLWLLMVFGLQETFSIFPDTKNSSAIETNNHESSTEPTNNSIVSKIVVFILLFSLYWGSITLGNIAHFVSACAVGQWWFTDEANEQYRMGTSMKRAFTTNFGTICLGSLFEAIIKSLRNIADADRKKSILACVVSCILSIIEKIIGYLNEWAFIFSALTGQGFVEASKSFIELFKKRGWTVIINDSVVTTTLGIINLLIGLLTAATAGVIVFFLVPRAMDVLFGIIIVSLMGLFIGIFMSSVITTILISCVRTVLVCFALNPAALGAKHPKHLERLSHVWHKFYPNEFAESGYARHLPEKLDV